MIAESYPKVAPNKGYLDLNIGEVSEQAAQNTLSINFPKCLNKTKIPFIFAAANQLGGAMAR